MMNNQSKLGVLLIVVLLMIGAFYVFNQQTRHIADTGIVKPKVALEDLSEANLKQALKSPETPPAQSANWYNGIRPVKAETIQGLFPADKGQPILLEFNSKYCLDCKKMAPVLKKLLPQYPAVKSYLLDAMADRKQQPALFDAFQPTTVPVLVFIQPDGKIANVLYGYQSEDTLRQELSKLANAAH